MEILQRKIQPDLDTEKMRVCRGETKMKETEFNDEEEKQETEQSEKKEKKKWSFLWIYLLLILLILVCLFLRSCQIWDKPIPEPDRVYEEDVTPNRATVLYSDENRRVNLAISGSYRISDEYPLFYIGFPEENIFDVVFTLKDLDGRQLYQTDYIAPGTSVAIDGTVFLEKGEQQLECLVSVYQQDSGVLVSDCTTVVLDINYQ